MGGKVVRWLSDMNNMSTILVKKSDGTSVRVSLDEFKKMKMSNSSKILGSSSVVEEKKKDSWESDDHKSLLDEEFHKEIPVLVREGEHILARSAPVKDIFIDEAKYEAKKEAVKKSIPVKPPMQIQKPRERSVVLANEPKILSNEKSPVSRPAMPYPRPLTAKPVMQDVKPPKVEKMSMSPLDELSNFNIDDFRRLGVKAEDSANKLREKFKYLEADSYLMFMEGVEAWYNSPLYKQYQEVISKSLKSKVSVNDLLSGSRADSDLKLDEFKEILKLNNSLY